MNMNRLDGDKVAIKVRKVVDKPGKEIILVFGKYELLLDNRCLGKDTEVCDKCKLKFRCYTGDALRVNFDEELAKMPLPSERPTISEVIQWYLLRSGVDSKLTGIYIEKEEKPRKKTK